MRLIAATITIFLTLGVMFVSAQQTPDPVSPGQGLDKTPTSILQKFDAKSKEAIKNLDKAVWSLFYFFAAFEIIFLGFKLALGKAFEPGELIGKILLMSVFFTLIQWWPDFLYLIYNSAAYIGGTAAGIGEAQALNYLENPTEILWAGIDATQPLWNQTDVSIWKASLMFIPLGLLAVVILIVYALMALQVFATVLEFKILTGICIVLVPFGILKFTRPWFEKVVALVINLGIKLMVMAFILGIIADMIRITLPTPIQWYDLAMTFMLILIFFYLVMHTPQLAVSLLTGQPSLSGNQMLTQAAGSLFVASRAINALSKAGTGLAKVGGEAIKGARGKAETGGSGFSGAAKAVGSMVADRVNQSPLMMGKDYGKPQPTKGEIATQKAAESTEKSAASMQESSKSIAGSVGTMAKAAEDKGQAPQPNPASGEAVAKEWNKQPGDPRPQAKNEQKSAKSPTATSANTQPKQQEPLKNEGLKQGQRTIQPVFLSPLQGNPEAPGGQPKTDREDNDDKSKG